jgi:hypothetical protein
MPMFTAEQIQKIKDKQFFPVLLNNAVLKDSGENSVLEVNFYVEDEATQRKIYRVEDKEYLKITAVHLSSPEQESSFMNLGKGNNLDEIIKNSSYKEVYANRDFYGARSLTPQELNSKGKIRLSYKVTLDIPKEKSNYISVGFFPYYDYKEFSRKTSIPLDKIDLRTLSGDPYIFKLKFDKKNISGGLLHDVSHINELFAKIKKSNEILDTLKFEIKETPRIIKTFPKTYFSNSYLSRDELGNLNLLFAFDYKKIIKDKTSFNKILSNTLPSDDISLAAILENSSISSLKIVRREWVKIKTGNKQKLVLKNAPVAAVIDTSQMDNSNFILEKNEVTAQIRENSIFKSLRAVEVTDKQVYASSFCTYQYGVELKIRDYFFSYVETLRNTLLKNINILKQLLNETNIPQYYDSNLQIFKETFITGRFELEYREKITNVISEFAATLRVLGMIEKNNQDEYIKTFISFLSPESSNERVIAHFLKTYEKVIGTIEKELLNKKNNNIELTYWFNDKVDTSERPGYGYGYFARTAVDEGFLNIESVTLQSKIASDVNDYAATSDTSVNDYSVSPSFINFSGYKTILTNFQDGIYKGRQNSVRDEQYTDLELDIKVYNALAGGLDTPPSNVLPLIKTVEDNTKIKAELSAKYPTPYSSTPVQSSRDPSPITTYIEEGNTSHDKDSVLYKKFLKETSQNTALKANSILNNKSIVSDNLFNKSTVDRLQQESSKFKDSLIFNDVLGVDLLFLALSKMDVENKKGIDNGIIPFQVNYLLTKNDAFFGIKNLDYANDLSINSKFLFLFNTICKIEYIKNDINSIGDMKKEDNWQFLTKQEVKKIEMGGSVLCRLKLYVHSGYGIDGFEQISLPFYDKYFVLKKTQIETPTSTISSKGRS